MLRKLLRGPAARSKTIVAMRQHWGMLPAVLGGYDRAARKAWSQFGEDDVLVELLNDDLKRGYFVDVGANHPAVLSNTFRLYCMGMRGISIEPNDVLCAFHARYRPEDTVVCAGVGERDGLLEYFMLNYHAFNTFSEEEARYRQAHGSKLIRRTFKPIFRLDTILRDVPHKDGRDVFALLSIDTEGMDEMVLGSNDWSKYRPRHILIESNTEDAAAKTAALLKDLGYTLRQRFEVNGLYSLTNV
ncbi:MAG TPA: FkbM family methyltransferase [Tepidisphaeraceae bacterium]|jgi:FkbM family methyltransferase